MSNSKSRSSSSSDRSSDPHSSATVRSFGLSQKYSNTLNSTWSEFAEYAVNPRFQGVVKKLIRSNNYEICDHKWNKMMDAVDADKDNALFEYTLHKRKVFWDAGKSGLSYFSTVRSAVKKQMSRQRISYSEFGEENVKEWFKCLKNQDAEHAQEEGLDDHKKSPVPMVVYEEICKDLLRRGEIVWWAFLVLQWNMMARSVNVEQIHLNFIGWSGDMMTCLFAHTKTMHGDRTKLKPFHLSTNQDKPWICPVTAVAILLMSEMHNGTSIFESGSAAKAYNRAIQESLNSEAVTAICEATGTNKKDIASHTFRKAPSTHVACGSLVAPSVFSILIRGGWSIGDVLHRYIKVGEAQDRFLAHLLAGRDIFDKEFHQLCPHFLSTPSDEVLKSAFLIGSAETREEIFKEKKSLLVVLLASAVSALNHTEMKKILTERSASDVDQKPPSILSNPALYGTTHAGLVNLLAKGNDLYESNIIKVSGKHPTAHMIQEMRVMKTVIDGAFNFFGYLLHVNILKLY